MPKAKTIALYLIVFWLFLIWLTFRVGFFERLDLIRDELRALRLAVEAYSLGEK